LGLHIGLFLSQLEKAVNIFYIFIQFAADSILGNEQTALEMASGIPYNFRVASVTIPKVPSDPMNKLVKS
jgi:hypothetical protein